MKDTRTLKIPHQINLTWLFEAYTPRLRDLVDMTWDSRQSAISLRETVKTWILDGTPFTGHWKDNLCRQAVQIVKAGREQGVKPEVRYDSIRVDVGLFRIKPDHVDITVNPQMHVQVLVNDPRLAEYLDTSNGWRRGECTLTPRYICLVFTREVPDADVREVAGMDINFESIVVSTEDETLNINTAELARIKRDHQRERRKFQKRYAEKQGHLKKVWAQRQEREKRRIRDRVHKASKAIAEFCTEHDAALAMEDLSGIRDQDKGKRFNRKLNNWNFFMAQEFSAYKLAGHGLPSIKIDPRKTSSLCPFCGGQVIHPGNWHVSQCQNCGRQGDRDEWASLVIRQRGLSRLGGHLFASNGVGSLPDDTHRIRHTHTISCGQMST